MASTRTLQRSFAGGEMSPAMLARVDDVRFQNGYASALNYEVLPNGNLVRRPGLRHVRRCKHNDKRSRLIPFTFSIDQTMQVEMGEKYFRFHQNGGTLLWGTPPLVIAATSDANDTIKFTARHGLASNTAVQFMASPGGTLPGGLVEGTTYFVKVDSANADAKTIQVSASSGPGATFNISAAAGSGTSRLFLASDMPAQHYASDNFAAAAVTTATDVIDLTGAHNLTTGTAVQFTTDNTLPTYDPGPFLPSVSLGPRVTFYVIAFTATTIKLALTRELALAGTPIDLDTQGVGTHTLHKLYTQGDLVHFLGTGHGIYYCMSDVASNVSPAVDTPHWYLQPHEGVYEVPHFYLESELAEITHDQSNDVVTLTRKSAVRTFTTTGDSDVSVANNTITETAHGMVNGTVIRVATSGAFPAATPALAADTDFYVVQAETDTFKLSTERGGDEIDITADAASGTTLTWTWAPAAPADLRREDALRWIYTPVLFAPELDAPVIGTVTRVFGSYQQFTSDGLTPTLFTTVNSVGHGLNIGESVYLESVAGGIGGSGSATGFTAGYHEVTHTGAPSSGVASIDLKLKTIDGGARISGVSANVYMRLASLNTETSQRYRVTAVTDAGLESQPSEFVETANNLSVPGSSNLVSWSLVTGAARYYIYKKDQGTDGSYGFIGKADAGISTFKDENIAPDLGRALATLDTTLGVSNGDSPAAVTHFEQRRFFGGTTSAPNGVWATRSGTEADLSSHVPDPQSVRDFTAAVHDDDRLKFNIAGNQAVAIRHLVPWKQLLLLADSTEFRIVPVNSEVLTPTSIDAKAHSYQGCSIVRPTVSSGNLVFCGARGGHVYEMGYVAQGGLSDPGDLCLRSAHLFDGETIEDQAQSKAPHPIIWFCSPSSERLLGLTYVPQEQVGAWHAHDTAASGVFESCSVTAEGSEDSRYFIVRRTINGGTVRSVEMMSTELYDDLADAYFVDAGGSLDGRNTDASATMTVTGSSYTYGSSVTVTANAIQFTLGSDDVGDEVVVYDAAGAPYRIRITAVSSNTVATGALLAALPVSLRSAATASWAFARDTISGLEHLEGETVQVFGDGIVQATKTVASGSITPATPFVRGCVGLGYPSPGTLLPVALQIAEAFGQGRTKNVNQAALRVVGSGQFRIGPNADEMVPAITELAAGAVHTGEARVTLLPEWTGDGQVTWLMEDPLPLTLLGIVLQVSVGD